MLPTPIHLTMAGYSREHPEQPFRRVACVLSQAQLDLPFPILIDSDIAMSPSWQAPDHGPFHLASLMSASLLLAVEVEVARAEHLVVEAVRFKIFLTTLSHLAEPFP